MHNRHAEILLPLQEFASDPKQVLILLIGYGRSGPQPRMDKEVAGYGQQDGKPGNEPKMLRRYDRFDQLCVAPRRVQVQGDVLLPDPV